MIDDDTLMSFIRSQQFEIKYLANEINNDRFKPRFKYNDIKNHINNLLK